MEWRARPAKLRPEAAQTELSALQELLATIGDKRLKLTTDAPGAQPALEAQLDSLELLVRILLCVKRGGWPINL